VRCLNLIPMLETDRLRLRPFALEDAARVRELAGDPRVADTTANIPHPYPEGVAEAWIITHDESARERKVITWAISSLTTHELVGCISLVFGRNNSAELGYWLGVPYWNHGFISAAAKAVIEAGFSRFGLHRIHARHFTRNPASGRVMQKAGMKMIGTMREAWLKGDVYESEVWYDMLASDLERKESEHATKV
jgi:[ribosomal protein S5]-alanine N-acetyltransferase